MPVSHRSIRAMESTCEKARGQTDLPPRCRALPRARRTGAQPAHDANRYRRSRARILAHTRSGGAARGGARPAPRPPVAADRAARMAYRAVERDRRAVHQILADEQSAAPRCRAPGSPGHRHKAKTEKTRVGEE